MLMMATNNLRNTMSIQNATFRNAQYLATFNRERLELQDYALAGTFTIERLQGKLTGSIAKDSSAYEVVLVLRNEARGTALSELLDFVSCCIGAPTRLEAETVRLVRGVRELLAPLDPDYVGESYGYVDGSEMMRMLERVATLLPLPE
jgi:hypothetical protein